MEDNKRIQELEKKIAELEAELKASKKYGLVWDKESVPEQVVLDCRNNMPILEHISDLDIKNDGIDNILIEGDNFHSLTALNYIYKDCIDVVYIDPPYNTLNKNFIYNDKYVDADDGYKHSKWLSFMKKRLQLCYSLLTDNGVVFISINDKEYANLKLLCDSIFGEKNVETIIWHKISEGGTAGSGKMKITLRFRLDHEYVIVCYKHKDDTILAKPLRVPSWITQYPNKDNDPRGPWCDGELAKSEAKSNPNGKNYYTIVTPSGNNSYSRQWHCDKEEFESYLNDTAITSDGNVVSRIWWGADGEKCPRLKKFQNMPQPTTPTSIIKDISQTDGNNDFDLIFGKKEERDFDNPKPVKLIRTLLELIDNKNAIVLDFFAGSGTTGQTVAEMNVADKGNRKFILCTDNENNICVNITYPRLKTVITGKKIDGSKYSDGTNTNLRYFKTSFIKDDKNKEQAKYNLVEKVDSLLCIKENIFDEVERNMYSSHYVNSNNHLFIYTEYYNEIYFNEFKNRVESADGNKIVYVFSSDNNVDEDLFNDKNIVVKPIPSKIYEIYKEIAEDIKRGD